MKLNPEDLSVDSFATQVPQTDPTDTLNFQIAGGGYCCTGCVSGCGYNPTASGCESGGNDPYAAAL